MTLMPEIHDELRRAIRQRRRWRWRQTGLVVLSVAVISGTAVAATGTWRPQLGSPERGRPPVASARSVPGAQFAALAVLRRPQAESDRGPLVREALKHLSRENMNGIHTDSIRVLFQNEREIVVLIPVRRVGDVRHPVSVQRDVLCLMSSSYSRARTLRLRQKGRMTTERIPAGFAGWGGTCGDLKRLRRTGLQSGTSPKADGGMVTNASEVQHRTTRMTCSCARRGRSRRGARAWWQDGHRQRARQRLPVHDHRPRSQPRFHLVRRLRPPYTRPLTRSPVGSRVQRFPDWAARCSASR